MCGRFTLRSPVESIASLFDGLAMPEWKPRFNIAPTQPVACVRNRTGNAAIDRLRWGLVPSWAKDPGIGARMINARGETVASKPAFRNAFRTRRCLVLADGFYEWKKIGQQKYPFYITRPDDMLFCMAGLWETWGPVNQSVETCTIITTEANATLKPLHERMPVILGSDDYDFWLDTEFCDQTRLQELLRPVPNQDLVMREVSRVVNKVANDSPACIEPEATLFD